MNTNFEIVSQPLDQFHAMFVGGGKTRSGKSLFLTQTLLQILYTQPEAIAYCIEFKEGTFKSFEGCEQLYQQTVAYTLEKAAEKIHEFSRVMHERIDTGSKLTGNAYESWKKSLKPHYLFFDEYRDDPSYTPVLTKIFSYASAYKMFCFLFTQTLNKTSKKGGSTVDTALLANSKSRLCFVVSDIYNSIQVLGVPGGENLLGYGDCYYKTDSKLEIERLQTIYYDQSTIDGIAANLPKKSTNVQYGFRTESEKPVLEIEEPLPEIGKPTLSWTILTFLEECSKPQSVDAIARGIRRSRDGELIKQEIATLVTEGLVKEQTSRNGIGKVYYTP